ncbi:uncharacterized protein LOC114963164 isoform X3 [Acropora millepora]|nr:uncharacterized protein LOC114963164 isoform X3 [Acropora millepora]XP_044180784.1 uncharacterized protein LOC114963164 isoform X3 [Acropora millepora]
MEVHSTHSNEDDKSVVGCEIQQENFATDSYASSDSSDFSRKDDFGSESTEGLSDTISMHMLHHIARGISCHGPVHSWWMYVYERMNSWICRRVTNRCHPEANVMETYRIFDWCQFMNVKGELAFHEHDQEKPCVAMQIQDPDDKSENSELEKGEFMVLRQSYVDHGMSVPFSDDAVPSVIKSFHRRKDDPITGKCITWVSTGKEKSGTLSSIVGVKTSSRVEFGKVLYFIDANLQHASQTIESACVQLFSSPVEEKESGLWYVDVRRFVQKTVPVSFISRPLVTAKDEHNSNKLWILNFRKNQLDSLEK